MESETTRPQALRRLITYLWVVVGLAILVGVFYAEENWRGKRAWQKTRRDLESKGARLNWDAYFPPPVPDEENIFSAPQMQEWFVKREIRTKEWPNPGKDLELTGRLYLAEVAIVAVGAQVASGTAQAVLRLGDSTAAAEARQLIRNTVGPSLAAVRTGTLFARTPGDITPARVVLEMDTTPNANELRSFFAATNLVASPSFQIQVQPGKSNLFFVFMDLPASSYSAADYVAWSKQLDPDLELIREALKRPYARMHGDYQRPYAAPVPNFVAVRNVIQLVAQRAQCELLLGRPEDALNHLTLVHSLCRLLEAAPTHKPMTLVSTMINTAVTGLYVEVIAAGLRLGAWREPQLKVLQDQLNEINLLPYLADSLACERAATCRTLERTQPQDLGNIFSFGQPKAGFLEKLRNPEALVLVLMPRGWIYQNIRTIAAVKQGMIEAVGYTNLAIDPTQVESVGRGIQTIAGHRSPYSFIAAASVPNFTKATQTMARNQSHVRQAMIACALERYRMALGGYPESLEALVPAYMSQVPPDVISGAKLKYRRNDSNGFLLYSVGWNQQNDGGVPGKTLTEGDWVWQGGE